MSGIRRRDRSGLGDTASGAPARSGAAQPRRRRGRCRGVRGRSIRLYGGRSRRRRQRAARKPLPALPAIRSIWPEGERLDLLRARLRIRPHIDRRVAADKAPADRGREKRGPRSAGALSPQPSSGVWGRIRSRTRRRWRLQPRPDRPDRRRAGGAAYRAAASSCVGETGLRTNEWIALERRDMDRAGAVVVQRRFSRGS